MNVSPLKWGVLGASQFAFGKCLPAMRGATDVDVVAVASRSVDKARQVADAAGFGTLKIVRGYQQLIDDPELDVIYNPLPNHLHVEWSLKALAAGKHVLCEKPIALTRSQALPLREAAKASGKLVAEAFMIRHHPQWQHVRALVHQRQLGEVRAMHVAFSYANTDPHNIRNQEKTGGGALYDIGCYAVNVARYVFGREPERVVSTCDIDREFGVDRLTSALVDFAPGHLTFTVGTQAVPYQRVDILGTKRRATVEIPFNAPADRPCRVLLDDGSCLGDVSARRIELPTVNQYCLQAERFARSVRRGSLEENGLESALCNMATMDALFRSAKTGQWEKPDPN